MLPKSQKPPGVDLVDFMLEDTGEELEEDTYFEKDSSMDEKAPITELEFMPKV